MASVLEIWYFGVIGCIKIKSEWVDGLLALDSGDGSL